MARLTEQHRRRDAHEKIQLGGLVVKAGLRECDKAVLLGAMIEVAHALRDGNTTAVSRWRESGSIAFSDADADAPAS